MSMTSLVAKSSGLNLPIASADVLNKAVKNMFPDSNITQSL